MHRVLAPLALWCALAAPAAAAPARLSFQGVYRDAAGAAVTGTAPARVRVYDSQRSTDTGSFTLTLSSGLFRATIDLSGQDFSAFSDPRVEVTIDGAVVIDEALAARPYALWAATASMVAPQALVDASFAAAAQLDPSKILDVAATTATAQTVSAAKTMTADLALTRLGTADGQAVVWAGTATASMLGLGVDSPIGSLHVRTPITAEEFCGACLLVDPLKSGVSLNTTTVDPHGLRVHNGEVRPKNGIRFPDGSVMTTAALDVRNFEVPGTASIDGGTDIRFVAGADWGLMTPTGLLVGPYTYGGGSAFPQGKLHLDFEGTYPLNSEIIFNGSVAHDKSFLTIRPTAFGVGDVLGFFAGGGDVYGQNTASLPSENVGGAMILRANVQGGFADLASPRRVRATVGGRTALEASAAGVRFGTGTATLQGLRVEGQDAVVTGYLRYANADSSSAQPETNVNVCPYCYIDNGVYSTVLGGFEDAAYASYVTVLGGQDVWSPLTYGVGIGGQYNYSTLGAWGVLVGGFSNYVEDDFDTNVGGYQNVVLASSGTALGGDLSVVQAAGGALGGQGNGAEAWGAVSGLSASALGNWAAVGGGSGNTASGNKAIVAGGVTNMAAGGWSAAGGLSSSAGGDYAWAAGRRASAAGAGSWAWADSQDALLSAAPDQAAWRAQGGLYVDAGPAFNGGRKLSLVPGAGLAVGANQARSAVDVGDSGYLQVPLSVGAPPPADCSSADHIGRMTFTAAGTIYVCFDGVAWKSK